MKDGEFIPSVHAKGQIADVAENATQTLEEATGLIKEIRGGKGTVGKLFTDDEMYKEMSERR